MKEVEEREQAADQAREEAARRHSDVWRRIEELKRIIQSAKEANDMVVSHCFTLHQNLRSDGC